MDWIIDNKLFIYAAVGLFFALTAVEIFIELPRENRYKLLREWLVYAVCHAEKQMGGKTGELKLNYVYSLFIEKFPKLANRVPRETFELLVDGALNQMELLLKKDEHIHEFIKGGE